ncbi:hypothetical protein [Candidatus Thiosymbion oneisti]|uniref:hypothetical protein n=1 Tax=Candidatus Thiosymbion oneisti TaxID=589554 RepID=UPI00105DAA7F|nr:hypothetical protein [Candidatus Thiosymbion oneisti]
MRKIILFLLTISVLLFLCYRLLFIFLDLSSAYMESDSDINSAGKLFLFVSPVIIIGGVWITYCALRISAGSMKYSNRISAILSVYGGLLGVVIADLALHAVIIEIESHFILNTILALSFAVSATVTFFYAKRHLIKSSADAEKRAAEDMACASRSSSSQTT